MTETDFLERAARHSGLEPGPATQKMVVGALRSLGEGLTPAAAGELAEELPPRLAHALVDVERGQDCTLEAVLDRVMARNGVTRGVALEQLGVVCNTIAELLRPELVEHLRGALPWRVARLFLAAAPRASAPPAVHHDPARRSLAEALAASSRPIFAARPDRAQSESVARSPNPHGDTKLSSARGLTQEREEETLATAGAGKDAKERSLASAKA